MTTKSNIETLIAQIQEYSQAWNLPELMRLARNNDLISIDEVREKLVDTLKYHLAQWMMDYYTDKLKGNKKDLILEALEIIEILELLNPANNYIVDRINWYRAMVDLPQNKAQKQIWADKASSLPENALKEEPNHFEYLSELAKLWAGFSEKGLPKDEEYMLRLPKVYESMLNEANENTFSVACNTSFYIIPTLVKKKPELSKQLEISFNKFADAMISNHPRLAPVWLESLAQTSDQDAGMPESSALKIQELVQIAIDQSYTNQNL